MNIRKTFKALRGFLRRYVNGGKGMLSLFLAFTVSPLLMCTFVFVEYARYQSANEIMRELMGSSVFSTLGNYDSYLEERFGLLSVDQKTDIASTNKGYLSENLKSMGQGLTLSSSDASGTQALYDPEILSQQLYDYSELSVPVNTIVEGVNLKELVQNLEKAEWLEPLKKNIDTAKIAEDAAKDAEKLVQAVIDAVKDGVDFREKFKTYDEKYRSFETAVVDLAEAKKDKGEEGGDDGTDLKSKEDAAESAARDYSSAASGFKDSLKKLTDDMANIMGARGDLQKDLNKLHEDMEKRKSEGSDDSKAAGSIAEDSCKWLQDIDDLVVNFYSTNVKDDYQALSNQEQASLRTQMDTLNSFKASEVGEDWDASTVWSKYGEVLPVSFPTGIGLTLTMLEKDLGELATADSEGVQDILNIADLGNRLLQTSVLYDISLDSKINASLLLHQDVNDTSAISTVEGLTGMISSARDFADGVMGLNVLKAITGFVTFIGNVVKFFTSVLYWIGTRFVNLATLILDLPKFYHHLLMYGYAAYDLPNRTVYKDGKTLTGYGYSKIFNLAGGSADKLTAVLASGGSLLDFSGMHDESGSDPMFKGAELEYMLTGANSEYVSQAAAFFDYYMFRFVADIVAVSKSDILEAVSALGPVRIALTIIFMIMEPFFDVVILANGGKEYLFKKTAYMSVKGLPALVKDLVDVSSLTDDMKGDIKKTFGDAGKKGKGSKPWMEAGGLATKDGILEMDYTEHGLLLLLICAPEQIYLKRLQNLIQLEAKENYKGKVDFSLTKAYTCISSNASYKLNPMVKLDSRMTSGVTVKKKKDLSY
ncbi:hypothetical protein [Oribacterium sp. oral taxon 078]|uniref:hypothetical protein n=1 Tax=Oribacterium sp. oral taxon 078 TaxID=652706 RepID=UPI0001BCC1F9|nr:hypothetical protein [Oribacterium sp. oral taxon 078]